MASNNLKPGYITIFYTFAAMQHKMTFPVIPVPGWNVGDEPTIETKGVADVTMSAAITALMPLIRPFFGAGVDFGRAEAWFYPDGSDDPVWVYTHTIGLVGTHATQSNPAAQGVLTFRTAAGGVYKIYMMEVSGGIAINTRDPFPFSAAINTNLAAYLVSANSWVYGRDNAPLVVPMNYTSKYNDAIRKKRLGL